MAVGTFRSHIPLSHTNSVIHQLFQVHMQIQQGYREACYLRVEEIPGGEVGGGKLSVSLNTDTVRHMLSPQGTATSVEYVMAR